MIFLIILGIILLIATALLLLRIKFDIIANDEITVKLVILGIRFTLFPSKKKKVSPKKFKKGYPA